MPVTQLTYLSRNTVSGDDAVIDAQLAAILEVSRRNNGRDGITGYLVSDGAWFVQILEGEDDVVMGALVRIRFDPRHADVKVLSTRQIGRRSFPQWSMGGSVRTPAMDAIFRRHGFERFNPEAMTTPSVLALAMDLQDFERVQALTRRAS
jgi:hypothetical protein